MSLYIVKHTPTGKYLPPHPSSSGGATQQELGDTPRLFTKAHHAWSAAKWWSEGITTVRGELDPFTGDYDVEQITREVEGRDLKDLSVIHVDIITLGVMPRPEEKNNAN